MMELNLNYYVDGALKLLKPNMDDKVVSVTIENYLDDNAEGILEQVLDELYAEIITTYDRGY